MTANNLPTFLLPKLKAGAISTPLGQWGQWNTYEIKAFDDVAYSLDVPPPSPEFKSVSSIPDMWARPLIFEMALHIRTHPLQQQIAAQWQGMLAAIACADIRGFPLTVQYLDLESQKDSSEFASSLYKLIPGKIQGEENSRLLYQLTNGKNPWQELYIFLWNHKPVGITTPSTLVCPSEEGDWQGLPWWDQNRKELRSPNNYLSASEKEQLAAWLKNLRHILVDSRVRGRATDPIVRLVDEFVSSLGNVYSVELPLNDHFFHLPINRGSLKALNAPIKARVVSAKESSLCLVPSRDIVPILVLLIFDPAISEQWGFHPSSVLVCGNKTLQNMTQADISDLEKQYRVKIINGDDLLLEDLHFIAQEDALPGATFPSGAENLIYDGERITPLLPINPILLEYFTVADLIYKHIRLQVTSSREVQVTLNLPLSGVNGQTNYIKTKSYPLRAANSVLEVPVLEVWPNFIANFADGKKWSEYYTFYCDVEYGDDTFGIQLPDTGVESYTFRENNAAYQISKLTDFPAYVNCVSRDGQEALGLILLKIPPVIQPNISDPWVIGVDFGTLSTNVYSRRLKAANSSASLLQLESLHLQVTDSQLAARIRTLQDSFIPEIFLPESKPLPLWNILTTKHRQQKNDMLVRRIFDGRIYSPLDISSYSPERQADIKTNLKWGRDNTFSKLFLDHLALHITAIAVKNGATSIKWSISYPSAFSKADQSRYVKAWQGLLENPTNGIREVTGISHEAPLSINDTDRFRTESLAIAQYFVDKEGLDLVYTTCIDIGGGTTDISIWQTNDLVHQCSVQLAGRDIFSKIIFKNPQLLDEFKKYQGKSEKFTDGNIDENSFISKLDLLLRRDSDAWAKFSKSKEDDPQFASLRRVSTIGIAGLYYYIGTLLRVLHDEGKTAYEEITPVYVGGNGSRLIHWLSEGGEFDQTSELNQLLQRILHSGSQLREARHNTHLSASPKQEVACGLVISGNRLRGLDRQSKDLLIAGESCEINDTKFEWNERLKFPNNVEQIRISPRLERLRAFLDSYHEAINDLELEEIRPLSRYGDDRNYSEDLWSKTSRKLTAANLNMRGNADDIREEPPFILGLKALLDVLGDEWKAQR